VKVKTSNQIFEIHKRLRVLQLVDIWPLESLITYHHSQLWQLVSAAAYTTFSIAKSRRCQIADRRLTDRLTDEPAAASSVMSSATNSFNVACSFFRRKHYFLFSFFTPSSCRLFLLLFSHSSFTAVNTSYWSSVQSWCIWIVVS